jgi:hypothetical protein
MTAVKVLLAVLLLVGSVAGCAAGASPTATPTPNPTAPPVTVSSPEDAAALVIASDPLFAGAIEKTPEVFVASKWWEGTTNADGSYDIKLTVGWGDCPAGCINSHVWTFRVAPDGGVKLLKDEGDPVPASLAP